MLILQSEPIDEFQYFSISPHPAWKTAECFRLGRNMATMPNVPVDTSSVGPIRLDCDDVETAIFDQMARDRGAGAVEFTGAVGCLAKQYDTRVAVTGKRGSEFFSLLGRRKVFRCALERCDDLGIGFGLPVSRDDSIDHLRLLALRNPMSVDVAPAFAS